MRRLLIDAVAATDASKQEFRLTNDDFYGVPVLRSRGLGTDDLVSIYEYINGEWQDSGQTLDSSKTSIGIESPGRYSVSIAMTTSGPVSVEVESSGVI